MKKQRFLGFLTAAAMCITALPMSVRAADTAVTVPAAELCDVIAPHQNNDYSYDPNGTGLKDYMGKFFRIGTCLNRWNAQNQQATEFIKKNYNSVTCENEMKPDSICVQKDSYNDNIAISLSSAAPILRFAEQNGIGVRGHTFVWYAQTPEWIFKEATSATSSSRMTAAASAATARNSPTGGDATAMTALSSMRSSMRDSMRRRAASSI